MSQLTEIIIKSDLVPPSMIEEMKRWGLPVDAPDPDPGAEFRVALTVEKLCQAIDLAIQSEGYVLTRETDLEAIPQYLKTMHAARLHVVLDDGQESDFEVQAGLTPAGEFIIPWKSDSITDLLTNGETYLETGGKKIFFSSARELFYGNNKAFIVCTPSSEIHSVEPT